MTVYATAGAKIYIGGVKASKSTDFVASDFTAEVWVEIKEVEGLGSLGDTSSAIEFNSLGDGRKRKIKGVRDAGNMELIAGIDHADAGQTALIAAEKAIHDYAFRIVLNDAPAGGTPSERLFIAKVMSASEQFDQSDNIMKLNVSLGVNSNICRTNAASA